MKKNNKGFSLVELIVVILIMAILGVALTPQVMKWVNNSRISSDSAHFDALVSATQITIANEDVYQAITKATGADSVESGETAVRVISITMDKTSGVVIDSINAADKGASTKAKEVFTTAFTKNFPDYNVNAKTGTVSHIYICKDGTIVKDNTFVLTDK